MTRLLLLCALLLPAKGLAAIALTTRSSATNNAATLSWSHTIPAGTDRILVVGVAVRSGTNISSVTHGGVPLTFIVGQSSPQSENRVEMWQLVAPAVGTANIVVNLPAAAEIAAGVVAFTGVDPAAPLGNFATASGNSGLATLNVVSATGEVVVDAIAANGDAASLSVGGGQTAQWSTNTGPASTNIRGASSTENGSAFTTMSWTLGAARRWSQAAVALRPWMPRLNGTVFEDITYSGGAGRSLAASGGAPVPNARIELYNAAGNFMRATNTDAAGAYSFLNLSAGNYFVRVVNASVVSTRPGGVSGLLPVQTFRTGFTDRVGGEQPSEVDAPAGATGQSLAGLNAPAGQEVQSVAAVTIAAADVTGFDFGFNFDTIVNINDSGQGSLRQFLLNANALGGDDLSIFMISDGAAHPGLRASLPNQLTAGVAVITLASALPTLTGSGTTINGPTQTANIGNSNPGMLGSGGTVGVSAALLALFERPEVEIAGNNTFQILVSGANVTITGLALYGTGVRVDGSGSLISENLVGMRADGSIPLATSAFFGIQAGTGSSIVIRHNYLRINNSAIRSEGSGSGLLVEYNEVDLPPAGHASTLDGVLIIRGTVPSATVRFNLVRNMRGAGIEVGFGGSLPNLFITENSVIRNGYFGAGASPEPLGIAVWNAQASSSIAITRNVVTQNAGPGVTVMGATGVLISQNAIFANGVLGIELDPVSRDPNTYGAAQGVTLNDPGDADTGPNNLQNFPIVTSAEISPANLVLRGFARPGSLIEFFLVDADPTGFGEGRTWLGTLTEGSGADADSGTGSYTSPINGLNQGSDTTARFMFVIPVPAGVLLGTRLTATATLSGNTSEFNGNTVVTQLGGVDILGFVYLDANRNLQRESGENGTGLPLFAKVMLQSAPAGPALQSAIVNPATGAYALTNLNPGTYIVIIDNNNNLNDVTPTLPANWIGTEMPNQIRNPVAVAFTDVPNQNFGLVNGGTLAGRVFADDGAASPPIANVTVRVQDSSGATTYDTVTTDAAGNYTLVIPAALVPGTVLRVIESNPSGYISTRAVAGNTGGTYDRNTDAITFTLGSTNYTGVDFADVPPNSFVPDNQQSGLPGTFVVYPHTYTAATVGSLIFSASSTPNPNISGWSQVIYRDANCNAQLDASDPALNAAINVTAGENVCILVRDFIPVNAPFNAQNQVTVSAGFTYTTASPALSTNLTRTDLTTVGNPTTAGLTLVKTVDKATALPGETLMYTVTYSNTSSEPLNNIVIFDSTPAYTTFLSAPVPQLPSNLTGVNITAPGVGASGSIRWTFTGTLGPSQSAAVTFSVAVVP